jgi:DNA-binding CsgD family transcriptional regulator
MIGERMAASIELIGRGPELGAARAFLDSEQRPAALLIEGEAGIGKTALWQAIVRDARERSSLVLEARPTEPEAPLAFAGLGDLFGDILSAVLPELPAPQRRALEVALLLRSDEAAPDPRSLAVAVLNALRILAREADVLLAIDDVQWLDASSARVLEFAARRLRRERIRLLLTVRTDGAAPLASERGLPEILLDRLTLGPLSLGALHRVLSQQLERVFPRPVMRNLHTVSAGNPLYAIEIGRALVRRGEPVEPGQPLPVPEDLGELLGERIAPLPQRTRDALVAASALSRPTTALVASATGADAAELLEPAIEARVVTLDGVRVRFAHPLLAATAYESAPPAVRRRLHAALAAIVDDPEERARHLSLAVDRPDEAVARALEEAARRAARRGAQDVAADFCAAARRYTSDEATRRRLTLDEAEHALQSGDTPRAQRLLDELRATSPPGPSRAEVLTGLARVHFNGLDWRTSVDLLEQALLEAGEDDSLRAEIELHLAINLDLLRRDVGETLAHARAAASLAERIGDDAMLGEALVLAAKSELLLGRGWNAGLVERAGAFELAMRSLPADRWLPDYLASMRGWTDDLKGAVAALDAVRAVAAETGDEVSLNWAIARAAELRTYAGRWNEALADIEAGTEIALEAGQRANEAIFLGLTALVEAHRGHERPARSAAERAVQLADATGAAMARRTALAGLGLLELSLGRAAQADRALAPLLEETHAASVGEPGAMRFVPDAVEALVGLNRLGESAELLDRFEREALATGRVSALAAAGRCRALLSAAGGDVAAALRALERSASQREDLVPPFERARALLTLGAVQRRSKQKRAARETLGRAFALFEELEARIWCKSAQAELARVGGAHPTGVGLTPTERRIVDLVAQGRSNKEIAAALFVTPKTVETRLSRIYAKLDVHSRTQLLHRLGASTGREA